jgi:protocatechuate 3,4-dioxygenase alpha subunit
VTLRPRPGAVGPDAESNALQARHVALVVFGRGLLQHLPTRLYFEGEALNAAGPVLKAVHEPRRATMIARPPGNSTWNFDLRLQGEGETV